ncbi:XLF/Cernunnos [Metarhizium album ARSEF 1941]|uniref:Non-homologous end-joining factor 1 n=1 Tax=Metarhizium album (strain ARSEF 1941) TaxID=1081103 RepID=A0A0B2WLW7_METAS|nr:XLF/Cernunnos [Metarhizium album ARSEF 1941]KHN94659.1 XLF/Cernunnos [Metarhizium album ARSEF 1941]
MASGKAGTWRFLPLPVSSSIPVLLVYFETGASSYVIRVSDMANIWMESLDRKAICMRGWSENTSIDPSDTAENMTTFLSCLSKALDSTRPGHDETSLTLAPGDSSSAADDGITLEITCPLPAFQPLRWPIHLKKQPPSAVATDLVLPLIQAQFDRKTEMQSLMQKIADKDAVITKLSDKLETMGTGLEHVFTALSGRKRITRSAAEDRVKGLAPFNERRWTTELGSDDVGPSSVNDLVQHVFGDTGLEFRSALEVDKSPELDKWWHDFPPTSRSFQRREPKGSASRRDMVTPPPPPQPCHCDDDDEFQVQSTPPHLRSAKKNAAASDVPPTDDASTDGEDDSALDGDPPSTLSDRTRQPETSKPGSAWLGTIGGTKQPAPPRPPSPPPRSNTAKPAADDEETASEASDDDTTASAFVSLPIPSPERRSGKTVGLGIIGGRRSNSQSPHRAKAPEASPPPVARDTGSRNLGTIGGKASKMAKQEDGVPERGRPATRRTNSPNDEQPRETSRERADRKREELKRELERKAAAGPAKKKRRF